MVEMCTREEPYTKELSFMDPGQVLQLVIDKDAPSAVDAKKVCKRMILFKLKETLPP